MYQDELSVKVSWQNASNFAVESRKSCSLRPVDTVQTRFEVVKTLVLEICY